MLSHQRSDREEQVLQCGIRIVVELVEAGLLDGPDLGHHASNALGEVADRTVGTADTMLASSQSRLMRWLLLGRQSMGEWCSDKLTAIRIMTHVLLRSLFTYSDGLRGYP